MSMSDPIADMLTRVRNAVGQRHEHVHMPSSTVKAAIAAVLKSEGFISDFRVVEHQGRPQLDIHLKYDETKSPAIDFIKRMSKPGLRRYVGFADIPKIMSGLGVVILSTSAGVMSDREARAKKVGGELICAVG